MAVEATPKAAPCKKRTRKRIGKFVILKYKSMVITEKIKPIKRIFFWPTWSMYFPEKSRPKSIPMTKIPAAKPPMLSEA